jgi:hypothetical protein
MKGDIAESADVYVTTANYSSLLSSMNQLAN